MQIKPSGLNPGLSMVGPSCVNRSGGKLGKALFLETPLTKYLYDVLKVCFEVNPFSCCGVGTAHVNGLD